MATSGVGALGLAKGYGGLGFRGLGFRIWGLGFRLFGGPYKKDYSILVSIFGSPYFGKLPYLEA